MATSRLAELFQPSMEENAEEEVGIVGGVDSMEAACLDVEEAHSEVVAVEQDQSDLENIATGLESVVASLEAATEQGGLDPVAAQFFHHAVDAHTSRVGLSSEDFLPGLESFGGDSGRQSASTVSMEGIVDTLKKIYAAVKSAVEKAIKAVTDFFAKIFGGVSKLESRIETLKKEVADIKSSNKEVKDKAKVKVGNPNSVMFKGDVSASALSNGMANLLTVNRDIFGGMVTEAADVFNTIAKQTTDLIGKDDESDAEEALKEIDTAGGKVIEYASKLQGKVIPGDKVFVVEAKGDSEGTSSKITFTDAKGAKSFSGDNEIDVLTVSDMEKLLTQAEGAVKSIKDSKDDIEKVGKAREEAMDAVKKVADSTDAKVGKVWTTSKAQSVLRAAQKDELKPVTKLASHNFSALRSVLAVVESSTKQYEEKKGE